MQDQFIQSCRDSLNFLITDRSPMSKPNRRSRHANLDQDSTRIVNEKFTARRSFKKVEPKNEFQKLVLNALKTKQVVIILGSAGVGKSFLTMSHASDKLVNGTTNKIMLSRPAVGMGNTIGLLKGGMREKFEPYLAPLVEVIVDRHGKGFYESQLNNNNIEFVPLEYLRGRNFNSITIIDEAQNTTYEEMYSILTRLTDNGQLILLGDPSQTDIRCQNGLSWVDDFVSRHNLGDSVVTIHGNSEDIVRGSFCKAVVQAREMDTAVSKFNS